MERVDGTSQRRGVVQWLEHALGSLIAAVFATGAIYQLPPRYQPYAIAALGVIGYLVGVRVPTPPRAYAAASDALDTPRAREASESGKRGAESKSDASLLQGQF